MQGSRAILIGWAGTGAPGRSRGTRRPTALWNGTRQAERSTVLDPVDGGKESVPIRQLAQIVDLGLESFASTTDVLAARSRLTTSA